jgi:hypothetical protein
MNMYFITEVIMIEKFAKVLAVLTLILTVLFLAGCPAPLDPDLGSLKGGPKDKTAGPPDLPESPDIIIYGVKAGAFSAEGGLPGATIGGATAGTIFLGEDATGEDAADLEISYVKLDGYDFVGVEFGITASPGAAPEEWQEETIITGVFPSGSYLVFKVTDTSLEEEDINYITYYKYLITWGQNGTGIESITIAGRTFPLTGSPYIGDDPTGTDGISSSPVYLTAAQIAADRVISVNLRSDSKKAIVSWGPSWPANNTMPDGEFLDSPINNALVNNSRIFIRVRSMGGDVWANYIIQVTYANSAVLGTFTVARADTTTPLGIPRGAWDAVGMTDGNPISVKSTRLVDAVASHTGGTNAGVVTWAFAPDLETEPVFIPLTEPQTLVYGGYIYVQVVYNNYLNIYRFPIDQKPLSDDLTVADIKITNRSVEMGTPAVTWDAAVSGESVLRWTYQIRPPLVEVVPGDTDADLILQYAKVSATVSSPEFSDTIPNFDGGDSLLIKVTSENGANTTFYKIDFTRMLSDDATAKSITIADVPAVMGTPSADSSQVTAGSVTIYSGGGGAAAPTIVIDREPSSTVRYAKTDTADGIPSFSTALPTNLANNNCIWIEIKSEDASATLIYKIVVSGISSTLVYGRGEPDPTWMAANSKFVFPNLGANELLTLEKMPDVSFWNARGAMHAYPDLFHFANGNAVKTLADWENRRKEISLILQYYYMGILPPITPDIVDITFTNSGTNSNITIRHRASGRTQALNLTTTLAANLQTEANRGNLPLYSGASANTTVYRGGIMGQLMSPSGANLVSLYGLLSGDPSNPSDNMAYAWGMSVMLSAIEGIDLNLDGEIDPINERAFSGWYSPNLVGITGGSRNGKAAEASAAFAESRKGARVAHVSISSAGSGGPSLERFISPAGYRVDQASPAPTALTNPNSGYGWPADPLPVDGVGVNSFDGLVGKPWYIKYIQNGDPMYGPAGTPSWAATLGGTGGDARRMRAVRGWSPYFEDFQTTPPNNSAYSATLGKHTSATVPFIGWQSPAEAWSGIQSLSEARNETPGWFSGRFQQFADIYPGLDIDHVIGQESRGDYGVLVTIPFDTHFETALIPPNGVIFADGFIVPRNNPESQFANWLIIDEVYKFLGEQEGDPEKYIWRNGQMMNWGTHLSSTTEEAATRLYHLQAIADGNTNTTYAMANPNLAKLRDPMFPVDDPITAYDYYRITWGRPDHPTIAQRIHSRVDPIMEDYYRGEMGHPRPANANSADTYQSNARAAYTPTGRKFKPMDWRGLIDTPEEM